MNSPRITATFGTSFKEMWQYRQLLVYIIYRDLMGKYKQTVLGVGWKLLTPFVNMIVLTLLFSVVAKLPSEPGVPYPILVYSGTLCWNLFATTLTGSANSVMNNSMLITKVYFPRLLLPFAPIGEASVDYLVAFVTMVCMMIYYQFIPGWQIVLLPLSILTSILAGLSIGLFYAAILPKYRDFGHICSFMVGMWMMLSPVAYATTAWPERYQPLIRLNPMAGVIEFSRWCLLGRQAAFPTENLLYSLIFFGTMFYLGIRFFLKRERYFVDIM